MCEQVSSELDYEYIRLWPRRSLSGKEGDCDEGKDHYEAMLRKSFGITAERETDLKMKSQIRPRRITIELLINVKGINVILYTRNPIPKIPVHTFHLENIVKSCF